MKTKKSNTSKKASGRAGYIDGFLLIVPSKKIADYKKMATLGKKVWMEHGALDYNECTGDDMNIKMGISFPSLVNSKKTDLVIFSWISYKSKAHRDKVNEKVMKDPRLSNMMNMKDMPFDCNRMSYGGFKVIVSN